MIAAMALMSAGCVSIGGRTAESLAVDAGPWMILGTNPATDRVIQWTTRAIDPDATLRVGSAPDALTPVPTETHGHLHRANLTGLEPGGVYHYTTGDGRVHELRLPAGASGIRFAVFGDMQDTNRVSHLGNQVMARALSSLDVDLYVQLGDQAEWGGSRRNWRSVLGYIQTLGGRTPIAPAPGNHDYYGDPGVSTFRSLYPYDFAGDGGYYSFDLNGAHFLVLDNFEGPASTVSEAQQAWATEDLRAAWERGAAWTFVFFHHTLLTTGTSAHDVALQRWLIPLADRFGVDAVFFAHDHHYEHWVYEYGADGLLLNPGDVPSGRPIHYFCSGGGGAQSEVHYGLLTHEPRVSTQEWYDRATGSPVWLRTERLHWDSSLFIDHRDDPLYGHPSDGRHYYHLPAVSSFSTDNERLGYVYGEETLHYILVRIPAEDPDTCVITVHYPSGDPVGGPGGVVPQEVLLRRESTGDGR